MGNCYKQPYLQKVIAKVDFSAKYELPQKGLSKNVSDIILKLFPIPEPKEVIKKLVNISIQGTSEVQAKQNHLFYHGKEREKTLCLTPDFLYVEIKKYDTYQKLKEDFYTIMDVLVSAEEFSVNRFGLRYINNILIDEENPLDWEKYLDSRLLNFFDVPLNKKYLSKAFSNVVQQFDDGMNLNFQYGMHNPDFPSRIKRKLFILDLDASYQGLYTCDEIKKSMDAAHEKIEDLFESVITDKLREKMVKENG